MRHRTIHSITVPLAVLGLTLSACGGDDEPAATGTIEVTAVDYAFQDLPSRIASGADLTLANDSEQELHELVALRIPDDEDRSVEELTQLPQDEFEALFGPDVATVVVTPPGAPEGVAVVGDGSILEPGRYAVMCFIPTGADPDEYMAAAAASEGGPPEVDGGPPHFLNGMYAEVTVVDG